MTCSVMKYNRAYLHTSITSPPFPPPLHSPVPVCASVCHVRNHTHAEGGMQEVEVTLCGQEGSGGAQTSSGAFSACDGILVHLLSSVC